MVIPENEIKVIATQIRKEILGKKGNPIDMCLLVCLPLQGYLSWSHDLSLEIVEGELVFNGCFYRHVWLKFEDGSILDPTASQFNHEGGKKMPAVYMGKKPKWYKEL